MEYLFGAFLSGERAGLLLTDRGEIWIHQLDDYELHPGGESCDSGQR